MHDELMAAFGEAVRCLACAGTYPRDMAPFCPRRYQSPHDEKFMEAVAQKLDESGALAKPTVEQHLAAIQAALEDRQRADEAKAT